MFKRAFLFIVLVVGVFQGMAQETRYRYLVLFKDKKNSPFSITAPDKFLSASAINRRLKNKIEIREQDLPVNPTYIEELKAAGAQIIYPLKWVNGVLIKEKPKNIAKIKALKSVLGLYKNMPLDSSSDLRLETQAKNLSKESAVLDYGNSLTQISQLGVDKMHAKGFTGKDVKITLLDDGFSQADQVGYLQNVYTEKRLLGTLVTDPGLRSVYLGGAHGTNVWSTIAAQSPGKLIGTAFQAQFALAQTEEGNHELLVEEANWMRGAEWADSLGTDIITSSLGYSEFDNSQYNHSYADMNGKTTLVTQAAAFAASKGIVCIISAGNQGNDAWKYITAPADADSILSVGAVDRNGLRASFSSIGPSADLRIKPDVAAMGLATIAGLPSGSFGSISGTSFSAPLIAGLVAGIIQANPQKTAQEIIQGIRKSGTQSSKPDQLLGYGIPNFDRANQIVNPVLGNELPVENPFHVYPNPVAAGQKIQVSTGGINQGTLDILNAQGAIVQSLSFQNTEFDFFVAPFVSGKYYFRFTHGNLVTVIPVLLNL
ncbi:S8 family peptidase [Aquirufa sp. OSTEICH-129V]|uniref:S8 family peptidase n=1 Tax=Aquirufa avitistagni TaxID=3104728 RepID=A0ABW6DB03_9BACT